MILASSLKKKDIKLNVDQICDELLFQFDSKVIQANKNNNNHVCLYLGDGDMQFTQNIFNKLYPIITKNGFKLHMMENYIEVAWECD